MKEIMLYIPEELRLKIKLYAVQHGITMRELVTRILTDYFNDNQ